MKNIIRVIDWRISSSKSWIKNNYLAKKNNTFGLIPFLEVYFNVQKMETRFKIIKQLL